MTTIVINSVRYNVQLTNELKPGDKFSLFATGDGKWTSISTYTGMSLTDKLVRLISPNYVAKIIA